MQPKLGNPPLHWDAFKNPKLRRFPGANGFLLQDYLGGDADGLVFKAHIEEYGPVAVKVVGWRASSILLPNLFANFLRSKFHHNRQPEPIYGIGRYWAFERECMNGALLEMIDASLRGAAAAERTIYLRPSPTTKRHALRNLWAFSEEGSNSMEESPPKRFEPFSPKARINDCLGWTELKGSAINSALMETDVFSDIKNEETYFCIIYAFVPEGNIDADVVISQLDFFHVVGFYSVLVNLANWRGEGVLVDFSDIVSPFAHELDWVRSDYAGGQAMYRGAVRDLVRNGRL